MKKALLAVAVMGLATAAFADADKDPSHGLNGGVSVSTVGTSVSGSYVNGGGFSSEWANSNSYGSSTLTVSHHGDFDGDDGFSKGVTISTATNSQSVTNAGGYTNQRGFDGNTLYNGAISFGSTTTTAGGSIMFGEGGVQPVGSIKAVNE